MSTVQTSHTQSNQKRAGGRRALGTFGYASFGECHAAPAHRGDDQPRRIGGLSYGQRAARIRSMVAVAAIAARKGQKPALLVAPAPATLAPIGVKPDAPSPVALAFVRACKAKPIPAGWNVEQYHAWLDERYAEAIAHQDEYEGAGLARPSTPAIQRAAAESERQDARDWNDLADLAATPEWDRALPYGGVETACALD